MLVKDYTKPVTLINTTDGSSYLKKPYNYKLAVVTKDFVIFEEMFEGEYITERVFYSSTGKMVCNEDWQLINI